MNEKESKYLERDNDLNMRIDEWCKNFKHRKEPCKQYNLTKYCIHLAKAEQKKFSEESDGLDNFLIELIDSKSK